MKRMARIGLPMVLVLGLAAGIAVIALADSDDYRGGRPGYGMGSGMGYGMGPGMMGDDGDDGRGLGYGMGFGAQMGGMMAQLPPEKREQMRAFHFAMRSQMIDKRAELEKARLALQETLHVFPLDREKAVTAFSTLNEKRREMFELRLAAMSQMQQLVGKELWEEMHAGGYGMGDGFRHGRGMGPGMGPGMGRGYNR